MELWKSIPNYEGIYEASNLGRIRTAFGKTTKSARFEKRVWKQRILKPKMEKRRHGNVGDLRVSLWKDGIEKTMLVARLVALAWCDGYHDGMTVNHIDGNPLNNMAQNLEWVSLADNIRHGFNTGLYRTQKSCVLTNELGYRLVFPSMAKASKFLGHKNGYVSDCIGKNRAIKSADGCEYSVVV